MEIALYIVSGVFALLGIGTWLAATKSKSVGHVLGGLCYVGGAIGAISIQSWWPLIVGFGLTFIVRKLFGDPHRASSATSRSNEFIQLCKIIAESYNYVPPSQNFSELIATAIEQRNAAENILFDMVASDPELKSILEKKNVHIDQIKKIYQTLILSGAGQWAGSEWVPAAGIATPYTLSYLIQELTDKDLTNLNPSEEVQIIAWNVLKYFKRGEPLP